jgi:hypothetical protein
VITISPGIDASGSRLPSTEHSTSMPVASRSTSTTGSCSKASAIAWSSSTSLTAFEIPTDDPSRAGLTNTGGPSDPRASPSRTTA